MNYGMDERGSIPSRGRVFFFTASELDLGSTVSNVVGTGGFFSGEKRPQRESGHFHLFSIFVELYQQSPTLLPDLMLN
jgi:hypothetical protein